MSKCPPEEGKSIVGLQLNDQVEILQGFVVLLQNDEALGPFVIAAGDIVVVDGLGETVGSLLVLFQIGVRYSDCVVNVVEGFGIGLMVYCFEEVIDCLLVFLFLVVGQSSLIVGRRAGAIHGQGFG